MDDENSRDINIQPTNIGSERYFRLNIGTSIELLTESEAQRLVIEIQTKEKEIFKAPF